MPHGSLAGIDQLQRLMSLDPNVAHDHAQFIALAKTPPHMFECREDVEEVEGKVGYVDDLGFTIKGKQLIFGQGVQVMPRSQVES
ncbi:hypothetical protein AVW09_00685 [Microbacterium sp. T32]|nr:hypothetical protein AVW09_00685 [Microbacterium sp. T32]